MAQLSAALLEAEHAEGKAQEAAEASIRVRLTQRDELLGGFSTAIELSMRRELEGQGFHLHRGEWRRKTLKTYRRQLHQKLAAARGDDVGADQDLPQIARTIPKPESTMSPSIDPNRSQVATRRDPIFDIPLNEPYSEQDMVNTRGTTDQESGPLDASGPKAHPAGSRAVGCLIDLGQQAEDAWVELLASTNIAMAVQWRDRLQQRRCELGWGKSQPLERLLIDRIVLVELQMQHADLLYAQAGDVSLRQAKFLVLRQAQVEARLQKAVAALALVRKLLPSSR